VSIDNGHINTSAIRRQLGAIRNAAKLSPVEHGITSFDIKTVDEQKSTFAVTAYSIMGLNMTTYPFVWNNVRDAIPEFTLQLWINGSNGMLKATSLSGLMLFTATYSLKH
jgi:hypothetical protein